MKKRTAREWAELCEEQIKSGLSQTAWCKQKNINIHAYRNGKRNGNDKSDPGGLTLTKTKPEPTTEWLTVTPAKGAVKKSGAIQIWINGFTIIPEYGFEESTLCQVCKALQTLC